MCVFAADGESRPLPQIVSVNSRLHKAERISVQLVNKTLLLLQSVGESATAVLVWHLCRLITGGKAVLADHLSLGATHLSCLGPGASCQGWTVSGDAQRLSRGRSELQRPPSPRIDLLRLKIHT